MVLCNPIIFPTATALVGLTIFTCHVARTAFGTLQILHLRAVVSPVATAMEPPLQNKAPEDRGHVAAVGNLFLLPLPTRASSKTLPNSGCTDNHITFLSHSLKQEAACCCTPCMLSIPCCSGSPTARWSRHLVKDDTNRHIPMHAKNTFDLGSQHPDLADPLTNMSTNIIRLTNMSTTNRT